MSRSVLRSVRAPDWQSGERVVRIIVVFGNLSQIGIFDADDVLPEVAGLCAVWRQSECMEYNCGV